jgi:[acyl-carrier-protein] S-malonyltransferase
VKKLGFVFAGQGSQKIGMGKDFFENSSIAKQMIQKASENSKIDFEKLMFMENDDLGQTQFTQPAILLVAMVAFELFKKECDIRPQFALGHSLGEFSAVASVGGFDIFDAIDLVHKRGQFMADDCAGGTAGMMVILGLKDEVVEELVETIQNEGKKVWCANYNVDGQIVLAGLKEDLSSVVEQFKNAGAKRAMLLDMSVASHCPLLQNASANLKPLLEEVIKDEFTSDVISNVTAKRYNTKEQAVDLLTQQLTQSVKYKQSIVALENEVDMFIEFGNGAVLKGLNKKLTKKPTLNIFDMASLESVLKELV